jgi:cytochrome c oxidase assembly protein subunit 15
MLARMPEPLKSEEQARRNRRLVAAWLFAVCALLALMVVVGGATRLTNSGLSITEWAPVTGVVPPLNEQAWEEEFAKYREIPQYRLVNRGMSLDEFKTIYWWEWGHRLLGRMIGVAFLVPFVLFLLTRRIGPRLSRRLVLIFVLGAAQGVLGWYMVKSGLADRVSVSQYRLAAHLGLAFIIFGMTLWTALGVLRGPQTAEAPQWLGPGAIALAAAVFAQVLLGAFVAGLRAGYRFNTWPLMEGRLVPSGAFALKPVWRNLFENPAMAQFAHRIGAYVVLALVLVLWLATRRRSEPPAKRALDLLLAAASTQIILGIWTLVTVVPVSLGLLHQAGALALFAAAVNLIHIASPRGVSRAPGDPIRSSGSGSSPL